MEVDPESAAGSASPQRLSRGQKKKIRQRAVAAEASHTTVPSSCIQTHSRTKRHRSPSSSPSPSVSSTCSETGCRCENDEEERREEAAAVLAPPGAVPLGWPSPGAELLSRHQVDALPPLVRQRLRLGTLPFPQPKDQLQWRILPLVRNALAFAEDDCDLTMSELARYVEDHLPRACLLRITSANLLALVELVVMRNVRFGRLRQHGKRFSLTYAENPRLLLPSLAGMRLDVIWVAWCTELKRPSEVALRYIPLDGAAHMPVWLCAELGSESLRGRGDWKEALKIGEVPVRFDDSSSWMSWPGTERGGATWSLLPQAGMSEDTAVELVRQVIQQDAAAATSTAL